MEKRTYKSSDGLTLHYLFKAADVSTGRCCLLLHGFSNDAQIWAFLAKKLASNHDVIAVDFRGHGDSDWSDNRNYKHEQLVDDVWRLVSCMSYKEWHFVGHSLGGRIGALLTHLYPFQPASCTLVDTAPDINPNALAQMRKANSMQPFEFESLKEVVRHFTRTYLFADPDRLEWMIANGVRESTGRWVLKTDPEFLRSFWYSDAGPTLFEDSAMTLGPALRLAFADLFMPVLLLRGQYSSMLDADSAREIIREVIPHGVLHTVNDAGHSLIIDNPVEFESLVVEFIEEVVKSCS